MKATAKKFKTVVEYMSALPKSKRDILEKFRATIKQAAPKAEEVISYNMPAFRFHGMLVYYAIYNEHIGFYPVSTAIKALKDELAAYETSKGTIKFPIDKAFPVGLVKKIVKFRVKENLERKAEKEKAISR